jgi:hypothetical protein
VKLSILMPLYDVDLPRILAVDRARPTRGRLT